MPSTLLYLHAYKEFWHPQMMYEQTVQEALRDLRDALEYRYYAEFLTEIVWPDEEVADVMLESLKEPEHLWYRFTRHVGSLIDNPVKDWKDA